jgi:hypothetical protein
LNAPVLLVPVGTTLRRLEGLERFTALGSAHFRSCFNVVTMLELEGPVTPERLALAAARLQQRYECLQVEVVEVPGRAANFHFRTTAERPRVEVVEASGPEAWRETWRELAATPVTGLAWRLVWVRSRGEGPSQLLVGCHHAIFDIHSASLLFRGLLEAMCEAFEDSEAAPRPLVPLSGALSRLVGSRWPVRGLLRVAWNRTFGRLHGLPLEPPTQAADERRWCGAFRELSKEATQAIVSRCRAEGLTLGNALSAALLLEVGDRVRRQGARDGFRLALTTTLDLRRSVGDGTHGEQMGMLVGAVHTYYRPDAAADAWTLGREVKAGLAAAIARDEHRDFVKVYDLMGPRVARWMAGQNQGRPPESTLVVSNFGQLDDLERGPFKARRFFITAAQSLFGATLLLACGTLDGALFVHLGYPSPSVAGATADAVVDGALARLGAGSLNGATAPT